jgi:uncharacterized protein (DUF427 family)
MLPFYAFIGKLHTLLETVAAGIHLTCEGLIGSAELFTHSDYSPDPCRTGERLYRAQQGALNGIVRGAEPMKAIVDGEVVADSDDIIECKGYQYFPPQSVRLDRLEKAAKTTDDRACPHGVQFYDVIVAGKRHSRAAWSYEAPRPEMKQVGGRFGFWQDVEVV